MNTTDLTKLVKQLETELINYLDSNDLDEYSWIVSDYVSSTLYELKIEDNEDSDIFYSIVNSLDDEKIKSEVLKKWIILFNPQ